MKIGYCTIASANYLSRVQILEQSLRRFHPEADFHILLCESPDVCNQIAIETGREVISPDTVGCASWLHMAFYYDITEYNTALKPFLLETLINRGYDAVIYLDPDIEIYGDLGFLSLQLEAYHVMLTPHVCFPVPDDGCRPTMDAYIRAGQFNLGFLGVSACKEIHDLLRWWQSVLVERCLFDEANQFFVDQFWADAIPSLIDKVFILRDPAYNMAYWNVFQRKLERKGLTWITDSGDLRFFHFSGLYRQDLTKVSVHQNRVTAPVGSHLYILLAEYFTKIQSQPWSRYTEHRYSFACYSNGEPITNEERKTFLDMSQKERAAVGSPFDANNFSKNVIRIRCKEMMEGVRVGTDLLALSGRVKKLQQENLDLRTSMSWKITAPIRKLHSLLSSKNKK